MDRSPSRRQLLGSMFRVGVVGAAGFVMQACSPGTPSRPGTTAAPADGPRSSAARTSPLRVAYVSNVPVHAPLWIAKENGAFAANQVDANVQLIAANVSIQAMVAREIDVLATSGPSVLSADLNGGTDLVFIASAVNRSQFALACVPTIAKGQDLKGKKVGTDQPGTAGDYNAGLLLGFLGLQRSDVDVLRLGSSEVAYAALRSGQIDAAVISPPVTFQVEKDGFKILKDAYHEPYQGSGMVVSKGRIPELQDALRGFVGAYRQGVRAFTQQKDVAFKVLGTYLQTADQTVLQQNYDFLLNVSPFDESLQPTVDGLRHMLEFLATTVPAAKTAVPEQFIDTRFLGA